MFAFSEELRATLRGNLGGVLFLDGGNVWAERWGFKLTTCATPSVPGCATRRRSDRSASTSAIS